MKKNKQSNSVMNKSNSNVTNSNKANNITNGQNIGFNTNKTSASKSFKYDENADHSFELRDCK